MADSSESVEKDMIRKVFFLTESFSFPTQVADDTGVGNAAGFSLICSFVLQ